MERILNDEEKIKRAEEIYFRRNNKIYPTIKNRAEKKSGSLKDKLLLHLLVMFNLTVIVFCIQNRDYIFSDEFVETFNQYNNEASKQVINLFGKMIGNNKEINEEVPQYEEEKINNKQEENNSNINENSHNTSLENTISSINEMELDVQNLKIAYKFENPLSSGIVSSTFGARTSKYQNVTGYHSGIDIAADLGTPINAAMEGIVELVSKEGDYGNHIKIRCNNVSTIYAHCSKMFVKEGQIVAKGQKIANVGNTGNSTGPHLHFEIRVDERFVDPAKVIGF